MVTYAGVEYLDNQTAGEKLLRAIESNEIFFAGRMGGTEAATIKAYKNPFRSLSDFRLYSNTICELSGFFPKNPILIKRFCNLYLESMRSIDYFGALKWDNEEECITGNPRLMNSFAAEVFDPFAIGCYWYKALEGKNVLIVHPFVESIRNQYNSNRENIDLPCGILPEFELHTVKAVQSLGGKGTKGYRNWFDALDYMKDEIAKENFDIALLGCGAYGIPLGAYIRESGKQVIYVGGCLQLFFGIIGSRWEHDDRVQPYLNKFWVRPLETEKFDNYTIVEGGCYW